MSPPNTPPKESPVVSTKLYFTLPIVILLVGIVSSNLTMIYAMNSKTEVLEAKMVALSDKVDSQVAVISDDVAEIKKALTIMSTELTNVRVELAAMKATKDGG